MNFAGVAARILRFSNHEDTKTTEAAFSTKGLQTATFVISAPSGLEFRWDTGRSPRLVRR
jgi:hypothetical protein